MGREDAKVRRRGKAREVIREEEVGEDGRMVWVCRRGSEREMRVERGEYGKVVGKEGIWRDGCGWGGRERTSVE